MPTVLRARLGDVRLAQRIISAGCYTGHRRDQILAISERRTAGGLAG